MSYLNLETTEKGEKKNDERLVCLYKTFRYVKMHGHGQVLPPARQQETYFTSSSHLTKEPCRALPCRGSVGR